MKSKWTRILLLVAVMVVWGLIVFRIVSHFSDNDMNINSQLNEVPLTRNVQMPDTFHLLLNYPDPFTGAIEQKSPKQSISCNYKPKKQDVAPPTSTPMPTVKYYGFVSNKNTNKLVGIVYIGGKQFLAKQGDICNGVSLIKMTNDSILVSYEKSKKWISK
jgi:hypothetical protein